MFTIAAQLGGAEGALLLQREIESLWWPGADYSSIARLIADRSLEGVALGPVVGSPEAAARVSNSQFEAACSSTIEDFLQRTGRPLIALIGAAHVLGHGGLLDRLLSVGVDVVAVVPYLPEWETALRWRHPDLVPAWVQVLPSVLRMPSPGSEEWCWIDLARVTETVRAPSPEAAPAPSLAAWQLMASGQRERVLSHIFVHDALSAAESIVQAALADPDDRVRVLAIRSLAAMPEDRGDLLDKLLSACMSASGRLKAAAIETLRDFIPLTAGEVATLDATVRNLAHPAPVRLAAALSLASGLHAPETVVPVLTEWVPLIKPAEARGLAVWRLCCFGVAARGCVDAWAQKHPQLARYASEFLLCSSEGRALPMPDGP